MNETRQEVQERSMKLDAKLVEKISSKSGKPYLVIEINVTPKTKRQIFPENDAEKELLEMYLDAKCPKAK